MRNNNNNFNSSVKNAFHIFCKSGKIENPEVVSEYLFEKGFEYGLDFEVLDRFSEPENPNAMRVFKSNGDLSVLSTATLNRLMFEIKIRINIPENDLSERFYNKEISFDNSQLFKNACGTLRRAIFNELMSRIEKQQENNEKYISRCVERDTYDYFLQQEVMLANEEGTSREHR